MFLKRPMSVGESTYLPLPETTVSVKSPMQRNILSFTQTLQQPAFFLFGTLDGQETRPPRLRRRACELLWRGSSHSEQRTVLKLVKLVYVFTVVLHRGRPLLTLRHSTAPHSLPPPSLPRRRLFALCHYRRCDGNRQAGQHVADPVVLAVDCGRGGPHM